MLLDLYATHSSREVDIPKLTDFIKTLHTSLPLVSAAIYYQVGQKTTRPRLQQRLPRHTHLLEIWKNKLWQFVYDLAFKVGPKKKFVLRQYILLNHSTQCSIPLMIKQNILGVFYSIFCEILCMWNSSKCWLIRCFGNPN